MTDGYAPRRGGGSEETVKQVLEAASAEFVEWGYDRAVVSNIARRAGLTTGAVYPRWPDKRDLMAAALDRLLEQLLAEQGSIRDTDLAGLSPTGFLAAWAAHLLSADPSRDVLLHVFGNARNNEVVQERLRRFVNDKADQLGRVVDSAKDRGHCDPEPDTTAVTLLIHAIEIGTHLLLSAGLADRHVPTEQAWVELLGRVIGGAPPQAQQSLSSRQRTA